MEKKDSHVSKSSYELEDFEEPPLLSKVRQYQGLQKTTAKSTKPTFPISKKSIDFMNRFFPDATIADWNDWKWQVKNSFVSFDELKSILRLSAEEKGFSEQALNLPVRITPYFASLLDGDNPLQALRRTVVPILNELRLSKGEESDPLGEEHDSPVPLIIHRYPDRALFLATDFCSAYCRYCTRSHNVSKPGKNQHGKSAIDTAVDYIRKHTEIRDVIISGGDPLTLPDSRLEYILSSLRSIEHLEMIRIGSKVPAVLPMRITKELTDMLKKYHPLYLSLHFTHPDEMTIETQEACNRLADAGIPLGSQTVLLQGINDGEGVYKQLTHELLKVRVRPYYLYQCDPIPGSAHFRTPVQKGLDIIRELRGFSSGYGVPHYVIDAPKGGGKIPLLPNYFVGKEDDGEINLLNYENKLYKYPDYL
jgi:lysine 2,3-aminomutase